MLAPKLAGGGHCTPVRGGSWITHWEAGTFPHMVSYTARCCAPRRLRNTIPLASPRLSWDSAFDNGLSPWMARSGYNAYARALNAARRDAAGCRLLPRWQGSGSTPGSQSGSLQKPTVTQRALNFQDILNLFSRLRPLPNRPMWLGGSIRVFVRVIQASSTSIFIHHIQGEIFTRGRLPPTSDM